MKRQKGKQGAADQSSLPSVPTAGISFGDGTVIELVHGEGSAMQPRLLIWDGKKIRIAHRLMRGDAIYVPSPIEPTIAGALRLPTEAVEYGSTRKLFDGISESLARVTRLPDSIVALVARFVLATWLADRLPVAPFLWIVAPSTASSRPLVQLLTLLCRRALSICDLTMAGLRALPMHLQPTIVTEASTTGRLLLKALHASSQRGTQATAGGKLLDIFCAKVVVANQPLLDPAMVGFPLEIVLDPARQYVPPMAMMEAERVAAEFQTKLLMYRLVNHDKVTTPEFDLGEFTVPTQELAQSLGSCIVDDAELQAEIIPLLKMRDAEVRVDLTLLLESLVLEALLAACHGGKSNSLAVGDLTASVNTILAGRGEARQVSPEIVGWKLRSLGLRTDFVAGGRKGLALLNETQAKIHSLAAAYGVRTLRQATEKPLCPQCAVFVPNRG